MKLDLELIEKILTTIENAAEPELKLSALIEALNIEAADDSALRIVKRHIEILGAEGFVDCDDPVCFGFGLGLKDELIWWDVLYSLPLAGYQLLEGLQNETLWKRMAVGASEIDVADIRRVPGLLMQTFWFAVERRRCVG